MKKEFTCIVCPMGCPLAVEIEGGKIVSIAGNTCRRGAAYAEAETLHPERVLTSTVQTADGRRIPVKTDRPIPKELLFSCMEAVFALRPSMDSCTVGTVLCENILNTGANLVATAPLSRR